MPVEPLTYVYIILVISDLLFIALSIIKKDWERLPVFVVCLPLFLIGFSFNYFVCPFRYCIFPE